MQRLGRLGIEGDIVECGVYKGGRAAVLGSAMLRLDDERPRKLWLFDSFAGMPPAGEQDGAFSHTLKVTYVGSEQQTRALLGQAGVPPVASRSSRASMRTPFRPSRSRCCTSTATSMSHTS